MRSLKYFPKPFTNIRNDFGNFYQRLFMRSLLLSSLSHFMTSREVTAECDEKCDGEHDGCDEGMSKQWTYDEPGARVRLREATSSRYQVREEQPDEEPADNYRAPNPPNGMPEPSTEGDYPL